MARRAPAKAARTSPADRPETVGGPRAKRAPATGTTPGRRTTKVTPSARTTRVSARAQGPTRTTRVSRVTGATSTTRATRATRPARTMGASRTTRVSGVGRIGRRVRGMRAGRGAVAARGRGSSVTRSDRLRSLPAQDRRARRSPPAGSPSGRDGAPTGTDSRPLRPFPVRRRGRGYERRVGARPVGPVNTVTVVGPVARRRVGVMRLVVVFVFVLLALRLVGVQVFDSARYSAMGVGETARNVKIPAVRGGIYDRNGAALALSVPRADVVADDFQIAHPAPVARALSPLLGVPVSRLTGELAEHSGYVVLAREVDDTVQNKVVAESLPGIVAEPETERVDPEGSLAAPLIGAVGAAGTGQSGLEYQYNTLLSGRAGSAQEEVSPVGIPLPGRTSHSKPTVPGTGIELTIDEPLQYVAEQSLGAEVLASHAKSGVAIVMNTHTGDILAMADVIATTHPAPTPPTPSTTTTVASTTTTPGASTTTTTTAPPPPPITTVGEAPQNLALTQVYEPGSVFKLVTFSAALQDGIITPNEVFTVPNSLTIDGWVFHDAESHPTEHLTATQILAQSSNIGTIEIAQQLGEGRLAAQIATLGFGRTTGLGFPAESAGLVKSNPATWHASDIGSTPIGQDDAVTAQQVLDMVNTVATGGVYVPPHLVRATVGADGTVTPTRPGVSHRVLSQTVTSELTTMMEQVVQDGTAVAAGVPGYTVAGKTGTAQIPNLVHGGYIPGAYAATFAGFAPAEHPALSAIVVLQQPTPIYGGTVAAPVFSQIMQYALHRYGIPTSPSGGTTGGEAMTVPFPLVPASPGPAGNPTTATTIVASAGKPTEGP